MAHFISTSRITKQIMTSVIGQWWGLFPSVVGISPACFWHLGDIPATSPLTLMPVTICIMVHW